MVNTAIGAYMDVQKARERLEAADRRVLAAYKRYQHTLTEYGPAPTLASMSVAPFRTAAPCMHGSSVATLDGAIVARASVLRQKPGKA